MELNEEETDKLMGKLIIVTEEHIDGLSMEEAITIATAGSVRFAIWQAMSTYAILKAAGVVEEHTARIWLNKVIDTEYPIVEKNSTFEMKTPKSN